MASFIYKARDANSNLVRGTIDAEDELKAAYSVEKLGFSLVSISPRTGVYELGNLFKPRSLKVSHQALLLFTRQLSALITTGTPLIQSLSSISEQTQNTRFKQIINNIIDSLKSGVSFSDTLSQYPNIFSNLYVGLIRVGEAGGLLDKVLNRLSELSTEEIRLRSHLRSALVYPAVLAIVAFLIVNFVLIGVLPRFVAIFEASSRQLPLPTKVLLLLSSLMSKFWWLFGIGVVLFIGWFRGYYRSRTGRFRVDYWVLHMPLFGPLILKILISRFSRSIAALTQSGIPVLQALSLVESTISNAVLQGIIQDIRVAISEGQSLTQPFQASGLFPPMVIQLINTGERSGKLDEMFDQIADFYEPEVEFTVRNLTSLLEPVMLLVMGLVVAFIALSVLLPIFNLVSIIRR